MIHGCVVSGHAWLLLRRWGGPLHAYVPAEGVRGRRIIGNDDALVAPLCNAFKRQWGVQVAWRCNYSVWPGVYVYPIKAGGGVH
jgi:hypothetical protein